MYVAVKGGERAIENAHALLAAARRGDPAVPELSLDQISERYARGRNNAPFETLLLPFKYPVLEHRRSRGGVDESVLMRTLPLPLTAHD